MVRCRDILGGGSPLRPLLVAQLPSICRPVGHEHVQLLVSDLESGWQVQSQYERPVGHHDLCAFTFRSHHIDARSLLGLASVRVDLNDEIWQFHKTHIALIVRRNNNGSCSIVGRAFILRRDGPLGYPGPGEPSKLPPSQILDLADDEADAKLPAQSTDTMLRTAQQLVVDVPALFALLKWVDFG